MLFEKILKTNQELYGKVLNTISISEKILKDNKLEFFPEYTDHGIQHIENVLSIAEKIISNESYKIMTAYDVQAIVLAILLHDIGMHIKYDEFKELIKNKNRVKLNSKTIESSWNEEWDKYMKEVHLWNNNKKKLIFGTLVDIKEIPDNYLEFNNYHKLLCGEFLRRHHARLAHEIIKNGFPIAEGKYVELTQSIDSTTRDLIGMIARSHGMDLWDALTYTQKIWNGQARNIKNINIIFIMVVLRMSDYFDIDNTRADSIILSTHKLRSIISDIEWSKQNCIEYINFGWEDDPELAYVYISAPSSSLVYLENNKLIKDIQQELDICWAVLGKVYGRITEFGLKIRRIKCNLEDIEDFYDSVNYIPERITFTSDNEILNLLVKPLYGDNPSYGIRELIQNAVDACVEKIKLTSKDGNVYEACIKLKIFKNNTNKFYLSVKDNGVGMTKDIIVNYFLRAGSSYRKSTVWKEQYTDSNNKSTISRSGKFGVGALASFILGKKIIVKTKSYLSNYTYEFEATIDTNQIEVKKKAVEEFESGTEIKVCISEETYEQLKQAYKGTSELKFNDNKWDRWYCLDEPKLIIELPEDWNQFNNQPEIKVTLDKNKLDDSWNSFSIKEITRIDWKYTRSNTNLICNGICIPGGYKISHKVFSEDLGSPLVSVIDNDGNLPLTLNRNNISNGKLPFERELVRDIQKDMLAKLLVYDNISSFTPNKVIVKDTYINYQGILRRDDYYKSVYNYKIRDSDFILNTEGYYLPINIVVDDKKIKKITKIWLDKDDFIIDDINFINKLNDVIFARVPPSAIYDYRFIFEINEIYENAKNYKIIGKRIFIKRNKFEYLFDAEKKRMTSSIKMSLEKEAESEQWICVNVGEVLSSPLNIDDVTNYINDISIVVEYYLQSIDVNTEDKGDPITELLDEYMEDNKVIPYNIEQRKQYFKKAFTELEKYMKRYKLLE